MTRRDLNEECVIYGIVFVSVSAGSRNREIDMCMASQVQAELKVSLSTVIGETQRHAARFPSIRFKPLCVRRHYESIVN